MSDKGGRPTAWSPEVEEEIFTRLADGESLISICRDERLPARSSVFLWVVKDQPEGFSDRYAQAREANGHAHADRIAQIVEDVSNQDIEPNAARVAIDGLKWSAERMAKKSYSPHSTSDSNHNVKGTMDWGVEDL